MAKDAKSKNMKSYLKKMMTQIILPLSVFSFILSHYSSLILQSYTDLLDLNFNLKFKVFTYTTERNCIFLLCNGILVFIIQSSGLINRITPLDSAPKVDHHRPEKDDDDGNAKYEESNKNKVEEILQEKSLHENGVDDFAAQDEGDLQVVEEEEDQEDDDGGIDTEELKKKCEEFIKKVKLEIQAA